MARKILNIIEPSLCKPGSHVFTYFEAICDAGTDMDIHVWADRNFKYTPKTNNVFVHPYFHKKWKKWQFPKLLRKLLKQEGKIFIPTSETTYLLALYLFFSDKKIPENKLYFFFHIVRMAKKSAVFLTVKSVKSGFIPKWPKNLKILF